MYSFCISFTLLFAASFGLRLEQFTETTDYDSFFDRLLVQVQNRNPIYLPRPSLDLDITNSHANDTTLFATVSSPNPLLSNLRSARRISEVTYKLSAGNLTLGTNVSFGSLVESLPGSKISTFGLDFQFSAIATVKKNAFEVAFTLYSDATKACAVDLWRVKFRVLDDIGISFIPLGYFNLLQLNAQVLHIDQSFLDNFKIDPKPLEEAIEDVLCSLVAN